MILSFRPVYQNAESEVGTIIRSLSCDFVDESLIASARLIS